MAKKKASRRLTSASRSTNTRPLEPAQFELLAEPYLQRINAAGRSPDARADKLQAFHELGLLLREQVLKAYSGGLLESTERA